MVSPWRRMAFGRSAVTSPRPHSAFAGTVAIGEFLSAVNTLESAKLAEGCFKALLRTEIDVEKDFIPEAIEYREKHDEYHCQDSSVDVRHHVCIPSAEPQLTCVDPLLTR